MTDLPNPLSHAYLLTGGSGESRAALIQRMTAAYLCQGERPPYLRVLGFSERGRALLGRMRERAALPVITKPAHVRRLGGAAERVFDQEARCTDLYALAYPDLGQAGPGSEYAAGPQMESIL